MTQRRFQVILWDALMSLIDHPETCKHVTVGNRYRMADSANDVIAEQIKKQRKHWKNKKVKP